MTNTTQLISGTNRAAEMNYHSHPLLDVSIDLHEGMQPTADQSSGAHPVNKSFSASLKRAIASVAYPILNARGQAANWKLVQGLQGFEKVSRKPDIITFGHKGFGQDIFLRRINKKLRSRPSTVLCFGCGTGEETLTVAMVLKPKKIVGLDYFNYRSRWTQLSADLKRLGVETEFGQFDVKSSEDKYTGIADLVYSHAVLEHIRDMDVYFPVMKKMLKQGGSFAAQWGPMWYSYSGDHISGELGLNKGFEHLLLSTHDYLEYYREHPRNRDDVRSGTPTWMELGLHNFATYKEYVDTLQLYYGSIDFLQWVMSEEAFTYAGAYPQKHKQILSAHTHISELDLALQCAGILLTDKK
jgi:SAM-dependent methyltransferase